jgi:hypothetical protein
MLGLSFMPCADIGECNEKQTIAESVEYGHEKHHHDKENCSPFCSCACCAITVCFQQLVQYKIATITFPLKNYPLYDLTYNSQSTANIWQPPRA